MSHKSKILYLLLFVLSLGTLTADEIRAAFDVGSGQTKMTVAVVDEATGRPIKVLFGEETAVLVGHDFKQSKNGTLSDKILAELEQVILHYRAVAQQMGASKMSGVATAVFRESKNGGDFIQKARKEMGIDLKVISQEEEGRLGFLTAVAASGKKASEVLAWDTGGGSFQITMENERGLVVYKGAWGASKVLAAIIEKVQGKDFTKTQTTNPATLENIIALHQIIQNSLQPVPEEIQVHLLKPTTEIIAIGGPFSAFQMAKLATGHDSYTKEQIWNAIETLAGRTDSELSNFPEPEMLLPRLTLLHAVMSHFGISKVHYKPTTGSTLGLLMSPQFWIKQ